MERTRVEAGLVLEARVAGRGARGGVTGTHGGGRGGVADAGLWGGRGDG